jgi:hypothetical protein
MMRRLAALLFPLILATPAIAEAPPQPEPIRLKARPAAEAKPALKYQLVPELKDMTHGNGATQYYRTFSPEWLSHRRQKDWDKFPDYLTMPLQELPREKLQWLLTYNPLKELDIASRKESCDWDLTDRLRQDGIGLLLPDMQGFREFGTLLAVKARLQIAEGQYDKAVYTLQTGFMLAKRIGEAPTLICHLVGTAISQILLGPVEDLIQAADGPNLYWALADLPHPLIDMRRSLQSERLWMFGSVPVLQDIDASLRAKEITPLTADQQQALLKSMTELIWVARYDVVAPGASTERRLALTALSLKAYPEAKKALIAQGRDAKVVEALPVIQVVTMHALQVFEELQDDMYKWLALPYAERRDGVEKAERRLREARARMDVLPLIDLLPAVAKVSFAQVRLERRLAALRCLEAVRMHAAAHDGKPPTALDEVTAAPIPLDAVTGKAFEYKTDGNKVTIFGPAPGKQPASPGNYVFYELTLVR